MSLFQCDNCGCVDNSACGGTYSVRNRMEHYFEGNLSHIHTGETDYTKHQLITPSINT